MNTFDIIILVLLILGGIVGFKKGLITGIFKFIGKIAAIVVAFVFYRPFLTLLESTIGLRALVEPRIEKFVLKILEGKAATGQYGTSQSLLQPVVNQATTVMTDYFLNIAAILILFILATIIINLLIAVIIKPLAKNLSIVNRGGGLAFGVLGTAVVLCLLVGFLNPFLSAAAPGSLRINESILFPWMTQGYDLVITVFSGFSSDNFINPLDSLSVFKGRDL